MSILSPTPEPAVKEHLHILQHSLGLDQYGQGEQYRNHYVCGPGHHSYDACRALVEAGLMYERSPSALTGGDPCFGVTLDGIAFVKANSPNPPKVSRSRARYLRFLEFGDSFSSFREFLRWDADPERSWNHH